MEINNIIQDYLKSKNTDYAIMINGKWGSGKTFYWKTEITDLISKTVFERDKDNKEIFYEPVYVSLYGLSEISQLDRKIFLEINPFWKKKGVKIASNIGKILINKTLNVFGANDIDNDQISEVMSNASFGKNKVICLDDLERLKDDILDEIFGYVNLFTEHDKIKVVILCDETEISKKIKDYNRVKEKLVRFTYNFKPDIAAVYPHFIKNYSSEEYTSFLRVNEAFICGLYQKAGHQNLRTLKFSLDVFEKIFQTINSPSKIKKKYLSEILKRYLFFVTTYCIEYKTEQDQEKLATLNEVSSYNALFSSSEDWSTLLSEKDDLKEKSYTLLFKEKYLPYEETHYDYFDSSASLITSGVLDENQVLAESLVVQNSLSTSKLSKEAQVFQELKNINILKDTDLKKILKDALDMVDQGKIFIVDYPNLFLTFLQIEFLKVDDFQIDQAMIDRFIVGIEKAKKISTYLETFEYRIPILNGKNAKYDQIKQASLKANESLRTEISNKYFDKILEAMKKDKGQELHDLIADPKFAFEPIFSSIDPIVFFDHTKKLSNPSLCLLNQAFARRYPYSFASDTSLKETIFYYDYLTLINNHLSSVKPKKISDENIRQIGINVQRIVNLPGS